MFQDGPNRLTLNLKITRIEEEDYGEYTCYAKNRLGRDSETMILSGK